MDDWPALFKSDPLIAIAGLIGTAIWFLVKQFSEKRGDNREIERLSAALDKERENVKTEREARETAEDRADLAFAKQLDLVKEFSEMNQKFGEMKASLDNAIKENQQLRSQVENLTAEVLQLRQAVTASNPK